MRRIEPWLLGLVLPACAVSLDDPAPAPRPVPEVAVQSGCPLQASAALAGAGQSVILPTGQQLWLFAGNTGAGRDDGLLLRPAVDAVPCSGLASVQPALPGTNTSADQATPLSAVVAGQDTWAFFEAWTLDASQAFGVRVTGRGVARWNPATAQFERQGLLWTADRPNWGIASLWDGEWLYVYGCESHGFLQRRCYAARVAPDQASDPSAYEYSVGGGHYSADPDAALPILLDAGDLSVHKHASGRLLLSYVTPLSDTVLVRTALSPVGPFSAPRPLFACDVVAGEFCSGGVRHPQLEDPETLAVTYVRSSFEPMTPDRSMPRLVTVPLPQDLP
jgi:hypothetical protein